MKNKSTDKNRYFFILVLTFSKKYDIILVFQGKGTEKK